MSVELSRVEARHNVYKQNAFPGQDAPGKISYLRIISSQDQLPARKPIFRLSVTIEARFSRRKGGRQSYQITREQLQRLAAIARQMEAGR